MKLLLVEDDVALTEALLAACAEAEIRPEVCATGEAATELLELYSFDAAVIDRGLPDMDGLELVRTLRSAGNSMPVIVLTAQSDAWSRIDGLNTGADDYLGKPFLFAELRARLNAVMRRANGRPVNTLTCGNLAYDLDSQGVSINGSPADLSSRERNIIAALLRSGGRPSVRRGLRICSAVPPMH